ncbi:ABC transporter substrate-binding protein [Rudanella paleaurantiibacter]|uniref:ABC transporter substrate-binding protein n=1 Tax=Rudanella paleaurantiibacter TaxID=2614655 RepID=A0A7J5U158_9BACT|nr:helical backbone metal receptor [Rudanella paleaurantiibacter]KAB7730330.1 ABC transporter substrate-binding protein [Rudanella paleaurantiibacter]
MKTSQRIISLVPSLTELLFDLGLDEEIVGLTRFCIHPADKVKNRPIVGGTKQVDFEKIAALAPTLILANKEENTKVDVEQLAQTYPVLVTDVVTVDDALSMIRTVGQHVDRPEEADTLANQIGASLASLPLTPTPLRAAYLIWRKPWMVAGSETFIHAMLPLAGFSNVFADRPRYPVVTPDDLQQAAPEVVLLSSEPYPFGPKHIDELRAICPQARIELVDGELFSWYGSRIAHSADYFRTLCKRMA